MGDVIQVDFEAARATRERSHMVEHNNQVQMNHVQACMLELMRIKLSDQEYTELAASIEDYDCYTQADAHTQALVDIYQMLEAF